MAMKYTKQDIFGDDFDETPESLAYRYILDFGDVVFDKIKELGMTYKEVAEKAGLKPSNLSAVVSGNSNPTIKTMERIAMALGCELAAPALVERGTSSATLPSFDYDVADLGILSLTSVGNGIATTSPSHGDYDIVREDRKVVAA